MRSGDIVHTINKSLDDADASSFARYCDLRSAVYQERPGQDLYTAILELNQQDDQRKKISSHFIPGPNGGYCYVRDARYIDQQFSRHKGEQTSLNYLMMGLNYTAALIVLLKAKQIAFDEQELLTAAENFRIHAEKAGEKNSVVPIVLGYESYFYEYLKQVLVPKVLHDQLATDEASAIRLLDSIKDWVSMEHEPLTLVTVDHLQSEVTECNKKIIRMDIPLYKITIEQKRELQNYHHHYWYTRMSPDEQAVYRYYLPKLLAGRVVPSQLRSKIPLLKNTYQHLLFIVDERQNITKLLDFFHSGSIPYLDKKSNPNEEEMLRIARMNVAQYLKQVSSLVENDDREIHNHFITLCSEQGDQIRGPYENARIFLKRLKSGFKRSVPPYVGFDEPIVKITRQVGREGRNNFTSNICLNSFRRFESNDYKGLFKIYDQCASVVVDLRRAKKNVLARQLTDLMQALRTEMGVFDYQLARLKAAPNLTIWQQTKKFFATWVFHPPYRLIQYFFDQRVSGIQILALLGQMIQRIDEAYNFLQNPNIPKINLLFGCASGENRTGLAEYHMQVAAVTAVSKDVTVEAVQKCLAESGHIQLITAFQGGNAGLKGIRSKSMGSLPSEYPSSIRKLLMTRCSDMKSVADYMVGYEKHKLQRAGRMPQFLPPVTANDFQYWFGSDAGAPVTSPIPPKKVVIDAPDFITYLINNGIYFSPVEQQRMATLNKSQESSRLAQGL